MMKDRDVKKQNDSRNGGGILKLIPGVVFLFVIFAVFALNIAEAAESFSGQSGKDGIKAAMAGLGSVEKVTYPFVNINGFYQGLMQRDYIYDAEPQNDTIRMSNGKVVSVSSAASKKKMRKAAAELKKTQDWLSERGIQSLYVQAPSKTCFSDDDLMPGISNKTYDKLEFFIGEMKKQNAGYIDARELIADTGADGFYKTDHHWTTETAFDVAVKVGKLLNEDYGFNIDDAVLDPSNYSFDTHRDAFLGAEGRRTGRYYVGLDDFTVITPDFETDMHAAIDSSETGHSERDGSFEETVMDSEKDTRHYSFDDSAYYAYWGGDYGRAEIINNNVDDDSSVIIFKDSYGIPVSAFLTNMFHRVNVIDKRYYESDETLKELIEETDPDLVMFVYGPGYLGKKKMFSLN